MVDAPVVAERLCSQLLAGPAAGDVVDVVRRLLAVQAQDPRGTRLAIRARSVGLLAADVDRALTEDRSVVISTLNRGTLHLVRSDDYWWLHDLTTPQLATAVQRRLAMEKVRADDADRGVAAIVKSLALEGPLTRDQLRERLCAAGVPVAAQELSALVMVASLRGLIVRGPMAGGGQQAFVLVRDWLGEPPPAMDRDAALGELARRYLAGHGPASEHDLAKWAGIALGDARRGMRAIASQLTARPGGLAAVVDRSSHAELPAPRLLGAFDPSLLGWVSRQEILGSHRGIVTKNGVFRPFAMVRGRAVATWRLTDGTVSLSPLEDIAETDNAALSADALAVVGFLGSSAVSDR